MLRGGGEGMKVRNNLFEMTNTRSVRGKSVGERVAAHGKQHLWNERPQGTAVDTVVVHYISASERSVALPYDTDSILEILLDLGLSCHFLVGRTGTVTRLVPEAFRAWHAGGSIMPEPDDRRGVNDFSIGVELAATADSGFTASQYRTVAGICAQAAQSLGAPIHVVGHEHVAGQRAVAMGLREVAKVDPGPCFDWAKLVNMLAPGVLATAPVERSRTA